MTNRVWGAVLVAGLAIVSGACGDDDADDASGVTSDERRYCELTAAVESRADEVFSGLDDDASETEVAEAQAELLADLDDELDEMVQVAPSAIADDVDAFTEFFRAQLRGEQIDQVSDERILEWEEANCPAG